MRNWMIDRQVRTDHQAVETYFAQAPLPISVFFAILIVVVYFFGALLSDPLAAFIFPNVADPTKMSVSAAFLSDLLIMLTIMFLGIGFYRESLTADRKLGLVGVLQVVLRLFIWMMLILIVVSWLISLVYHGDNTNQDIINQQLVNYPLYTYFQVLVYAPVVEETVFRGVFYRMFRKHSKVFAFVLSSLIFGGLHLLAGFLAGDFTQIMNLPIYAGIGFFLALAYEKTGSIHAGMLLHFIWNLWSVLF